MWFVSHHINIMEMIFRHIHVLVDAYSVYLPLGLSSSSVLFYKYPSLFFFSSASSHTFLSIKQKTFSFNNLSIKRSTSMAIRISRVLQSSKQLLKSLSHSSNNVAIPKGHLAVYVGEMMQKRRFVVPVTYLSHPCFQKLLRKAEEEFGFDHPMGGLTIPCTEQIFIDLASRLSTSS
jgi:SAUR family protein